MMLPKFYQKNFKTSFRVTDQVKNNCSKVKSKIPIENLSNVIYQVNCKNDNCNKNYIGLTTQLIKKRVAQHRYALKSEPEKSALAVHSYETGHQIDFNNFKILDKANDFGCFKVKESWHIAYNNLYYPNRLLNRKNEVPSFQSHYAALF